MAGVTLPPGDVTRWQDVEVPPRIRRRPLEQHGFPVPYVAQSTAERQSTAGRRGGPRDGLLDGIVLMTHKGWSPKAMEAQEPEAGWQLGEMNEERQRDCMLTPRCQVCALQLKARGPWWFVAGLPEDALSVTRRDDDVRAPVFREPALCSVCVTYALQVCPGLRKGNRGTSTGASTVTVYRVHERRLAAEGARISSLGHGGEKVKRLLTLDDARRSPVVVYNVVAVAADWEAWTWRQWLDAWFSGRGLSEPVYSARKHLT